MVPYPNFAYTPGLTLAIEAANITIVCRAGSWLVSDLAAAQAVVAAYDALAGAQAQQASIAATTRWNVMTGGHTTAAGIPLATDPTSIALITGLASAAQSGYGTPPYSFKARGESTFRSLSATDVATMYADLTSFVQSCYNSEGAISQALQAATTVQDVMAIDPTAGFPANT